LRVGLVVGGSPTSQRVHGDELGRGGVRRSRFRGTSPTARLGTFERRKTFDRSNRSCGCLAPCLRWWRSVSPPWQLLRLVRPLNLPARRRLRALPAPQYKRRTAQSAVSPAPALVVSMSGLASPTRHHRSATFGGGHHSRRRPGPRHFGPRPSAARAPQPRANGVVRTACT
jgi:hypothetical protein